MKKHTRRLDEIRQFEMLDPARVLQIKQESRNRTCAGCAEIRFIENPFDGRKNLKCAIGKEIGKRCSNYQERTGNE
ncbi:MAG: hypothetical protein CML17_11985 [Pusillimonas sp.]|jgi:hypothetical protein|nr:hypothetical protein [Pusillimonas sp.]|tara:strand:+ start:237 stop:464 length:228 start_codon:yes stop_codon:yes gene_type:complete